MTSIIQITDTHVTRGLRRRALVLELEESDTTVRRVFELRIQFFGKYVYLSIYIYIYIYIFPAIDFYGV